MPEVSFIVHFWICYLISWVFCMDISRESKKLYGHIHFLVPSQKQILSSNRASMFYIHYILITFFDTFLAVLNLWNVSKGTILLQVISFFFGTKQKIYQLHDYQLCFNKLLTSFLVFNTSECFLIHSSVNLQIFTLWKTSSTTYSSLFMLGS